MKNSPIRWVGGKSRLRKQIIERIPEHECYVDVFGGGAWVLFAKEPSAAEVYNDVDGELVNLFLTIQKRPEEFLESFNLMFHSREIFERFKATDPIWLDEVTRAVRYYYLIKASFGGKMQHYGTSTTRRRFINLEGIRKSILEAHERLEHVQVESLTCELCLEKYDRPHSFFYCDHRITSWKGIIEASSVPEGIVSSPSISRGSKGGGCSATMTIRRFGRCIRAFGSRRSRQLITSAIRGAGASASPSF